MDALGIAVTDEVQFHWTIEEGLGVLLDPEESKADHVEAVCEVTSDSVGSVAVKVTATQKSVVVEDVVSVRFLAGAGTDDTTKGLPSYRLEAFAGEPWRSQYVLQNNEIIINSAHRDFVGCKNSPTKYRRYIGKLYAKEVVLINFSHEPSGDVMERLIEVLVRTEDLL